MREFSRVVEDCLADLRRIRASGGVTGERSGYGPLANLLNEIGGGRKPKVFSVGELAKSAGWLTEVHLVRSQSIGCGPLGLALVDREDLGLPKCGARA